MRITGAWLSRLGAPLTFLKTPSVSVLVLAAFGWALLIVGLHIVNRGLYDIVIVGHPISWAFGISAVDFSVRHYGLVYEDGRGVLFWALQEARLIRL